MPTASLNFKKVLIGPLRARLRAFVKFASHLPNLQTFSSKALIQQNLTKHRGIIEMSILEKLKQYPFWGYLRLYRGRYLLGFISLLGVDAVNVALPLVVKMGIDSLSRSNMHNALQGIRTAALLYLGLMLLQSWGRYLWRVYLIGTSHLIAKDLRLKLYRHIQRLPMDYYQRSSTGDLMSRATNDIESIRMATGPGILVTADAVMMLVMIVPVMFYLSPKLALLAFAFYPVVPWLTAKIGNRIDTLFDRLQKKMSQMSSFAQESFAGVRLIRSLVIENQICQRFKDISEAYSRDGIELAKVESFFSPTLGLLTNLGSFFILLWGGLDVIEGVVSIGTFVAFQRFVVQLSWPMEAIGWAVTMHREGASAQKRYFEVMEVSPVEEIRMPQVTVKEKAVIQIETLRSGIHVQDLTFSYQDNQNYQKKGFELSLSKLRIAPGQKIGIVGKVGSGKSTFFNLLMRLHEPPPGTLFINEQDLVSINLKEIRQKIAMVEQQVFLFSESVEDNVNLGLSGIAPDELQRLASLVQMADEIKLFPAEMRTLLGERGINLSGGQKQRLALLRALRRKPEFLLLDDAFSAVDVNVEAKIIDNLFSGYSEMGVIFASHRLSVMARMDEVWVFQEGRVIEIGAHEELLQNSRLYSNLWEQSSRRIEKELRGWVDPSQEMR